MLYMEGWLHSALNRNLLWLAAASPRKREYNVGLKFAVHSLVRSYLVIPLQHKFHKRTHFDVLNRIRGTPQ